MSLSKDVSYLLNILVSLLTLTLQWIWTLSPVNKAASSLAREQSLHFKCLAKQATREHANDAAKGEAKRAERKRTGEGRSKRRAISFFSPVLRSHVFFRVSLTRDFSLYLLNGERARRLLVFFYNS